jgi:uncharacterized protein (TIGR03663 family)
MNRAFLLALIFGIFLALILRVPDLDQRPFHNDEAVNALKCKALLEGGDYAYDLDEFHGPALHYATLLWARATGWTGFSDTTEASFRGLTVVFGLALIPALILVRDALGRSATGWAALCTALSPVLTYFSRDYIHEMLLVAFTFLFIACGWRYSRRPGWRWALAAGVSLGGMQATKETFVLSLLAMLLGWAALRVVEGTPTNGASPPSRRIFGHALVLLGGWAVVWMLLFSSFGQNPAGLLDSFRTYWPWLGRAGGESVHIHPRWFFAERWFWWPSGGVLPWTELGLFSLATVAVGSAWTRRGLGDASGAFVRWLTLYAAFLFVVYSLIPYKTPWCILGVAHGLVLLAGVGLAVLWRAARKLSHRVALAGITGVLLGHTLWQAWMLSHDPASARDNPWAYADTSLDIRNLTELIRRVTATTAGGVDTHLQVICAQDDYWPLPYELRHWRRVGWWPAPPPDPPAPLVVVSPHWSPAREADPAYVNAGTFQLRRGVFRVCYVQREVWTNFLKRSASP